MCYIVRMVKRNKKNLSSNNIISYYSHEFSNTISVEEFKLHLQEIKKCNFNTIVFCISEATLNSSKKRDFLKGAVKYAQSRNMVCLADPWGVGNVFGGEGISYFKATSDFPCFCNSSFERLMLRWVYFVLEIHCDGVFWDEPEFKFNKNCSRHNEYDLIAHFSEITKSCGLYNSICIPADLRRVGLINKIAELSCIDEIGTDPYWPNVFVDITVAERNSYIQIWTNIINNIAKKQNKKCHIWLQGFGIRKEDKDMLNTFASIIKQSGINSIAFWGFAGFNDHLNNCDSTNLSSLETWENVKPVFAL